MGFTYVLSAAPGSVPPGQTQVKHGRLDQFEFFHSSGQSLGPTVNLPHFSPPLHDYLMVLTHIPCLTNKQETVCVHTSTPKPLHPPSLTDVWPWLSPLLSYILVRQPALWGCHYPNRQMNVGVERGRREWTDDRDIIFDGWGRDLWHLTSYRHLSRPTSINLHPPLSNVLLWLHIWSTWFNVKKHYLIYDVLLHFSTVSPGRWSWLEVQSPSEGIHHSSEGGRKENTAKVSQWLNCISN